MVALGDGKEEKYKRGPLYFVKFFKIVYFSMKISMKMEKISLTTLINIARIHILLKQNVSDCEKVG